MTDLGKNDKIPARESAQWISSLTMTHINLPPSVPPFSLTGLLLNQELSGRKWGDERGVKAIQFLYEILPEDHYV